MAKVTFSHSYCGHLTIETGIDYSAWSYGLNTQTYPTFGGEVVQILSVFIDDLTLKGTVSSYAQLETIYRYFAKYLIAATQGHTRSPVPNESYNLDPMTFIYPARGWTFYIYPLAVPGFAYATGTVGPQWQLQAHVIDDSPDIGVIKDGIEALSIKSINSVAGTPVKTQGTFKLSGNISPKYGNPNADPFQTDDPFNRQEATQAGQWADYYSSLIPAYMKGDFSSLTGVVGSQPNFGKKGKADQHSVKVTQTPDRPKRSTPKRKVNRGGRRKYG